MLTNFVFGDFKVRIEDDKLDILNKSKNLGVVILLKTDAQRDMVEALFTHLLLRKGRENPEREVHLANMVASLAVMVGEKIAKGE